MCGDSFGGVQYDTFKRVFGRTKVFENPKKSWICFISSQCFSWFQQVYLYGQYQSFYHFLGDTPARCVSKVASPCKLVRHVLIVLGKAVSVEIGANYEAAGRVKVVLARIAPRSRDAWLSWVIPNLLFHLIIFHFLRKAGRVSWYCMNDWSHD